jgi:hypothetical protein
MRIALLVVLVCACLPPGRGGAATGCPPPAVSVGTIIGLAFCIDPAFQAPIEAHLLKIRADVAARRQAGTLVAYALAPVESGPGANERIDLEIAASVTARLAADLGHLVWVLNPAAYRLPPSGSRTPDDEEHMLLWTRFLAGEDGLGRDVDLAYFSGPRDTRAYFGCAGGDLTGCMTRWIAARASGDDVFRREMAAEPAGPAAFLRHYVLRASTAYSKAAHDQWNALVRVNRRRHLGEQIGIYFDGRPVSPAEMETQVSPGFERR